MRRTFGSGDWLLLGVGVAAWLLASRPQAEAPAPATEAVADDIAEPPRMAMLAAAAAFCALLALGIIGIIQVSQMRADSEVARALTGGDPARAAVLITRYGCGGCHTVTGVPGAHGRVAPPLNGLRERVYLAGVLRNTSGNLIQWIVDPHSLSPRTAMPATGISGAEAADVAAWLYAH